jgi:2-phosphosulfolactate phosphatase
MRKVHVITQKEAVNEQKLEGCTAVVIDVFLATSTIAFLLENNFEPVYAVMDSDAALNLAKLQDGPFVLLGETKGAAIDGFMYPDPCLFTPTEIGTSAIICSTNGTKAINKASRAKELYISSLVNGHLIAQRIDEQSDDSSIVIICSGNDDRFSMEDFIGAGQIVEHLMNKGEYAFSDSSKLARDAYRSSLAISFQNLLDCETAKLLCSLDYSESLELVIKYHEKLEIVPVVIGNKIVKAHQKTKIG